MHEHDSPSSGASRTAYRWTNVVGSISYLSEGSAVDFLTYLKSETPLSMIPMAPAEELRSVVPPVSMSIG